MVRTDAKLRLCPTCGEWTAALLCPRDQQTTVVLRPTTEPRPLAIGDLVGDRFCLERVLGQGGYATVFAGRHVLTGQEIAIKVLKAAHPGPDEEAVRRFFREARVTAQLTHPNTVRLYDVGQSEGGSFWLAMELLRGHSLEEELQQLAAQHQVLPQSRAIDVAAQVLKALHEAHGKGLVHRDLKPANIMLASVAGETVVKVLDFGIAQTHGSDLTATGMALGTPAYMSPEQCQGLDLDGRSDLYALGIVLYRCVSGDVPFADANPVHLMQAHLSRALPDLQGAAKTALSAGFVETVERALSKPLAARWQTALAMREALEAAQIDLSQTALEMPAFRVDRQPPARPFAQTVRSAAAPPVERIVPASLAELLGETKSPKG